MEIYKTILLTYLQKRRHFLYEGSSWPEGKVCCRNALGVGLGSDKVCEEEKKLLHKIDSKRCCSFYKFEGILCIDWPVAGKSGEPRMKLTRFTPMVLYSHL